MNILISEKPASSLIRFLIIFSLLLLPGALTIANSENESVKINDNIKIKRNSADKVSLIVYYDSKKAEEFFFTDFNADVVLLLYRRVEMDIIIKNLSKKYFISKTDARRYVKMTINTLEQWNLVSRN